MSPLRYTVEVKMPLDVPPAMTLTVGMIVGELTAGRSLNDILAENPDLDEADIQEAQALVAASRLSPA